MTMNERAAKSRRRSTRLELLGVVFATLGMALGIFGVVRVMLTGTDGLGRFLLAVGLGLGCFFATAVCVRKAATERDRDDA